LHYAVTSRPIGVKGRTKATTEPKDHAYAIRSKVRTTLSKKIGALSYFFMATNKRRIAIIGIRYPNLL